MKALLALLLVLIAAPATAGRYTNPYTGKDSTIVWRGHSTMTVADAELLEACRCNKLVVLKDSHRPRTRQRVHRAIPTPARVVPCSPVPCKPDTLRIITERIIERVPEQIALTAGVPRGHGWKWFAGGVLAGAVVTAIIKNTRHEHTVTYVGAPRPPSSGGGGGEHHPKPRDGWCGE